MGAVEAASGPALPHSPLAEPGILLRMLAPAIEDERPAGASVGAFLTGATPGRFAWAVAAVVWCVLDVAATLGRDGPVGFARALPLVSAVGASGFGFGLVLPTRPRRVALVDFACVLLLLGAAVAGWSGHDLPSMGCTALVVGLWLGQRVPAPAAAGRTLAAAVGIAVVVSVGVAWLQPWVAVTLGASAARAVAVALLLLLLVPAWAPPARTPRPCGRAAGFLLPSAFVMAWLAPPLFVAGGTTAASAWFAVAVGCALLPLWVGRPGLTAVVACAATLLAAWLAGPAAPAAATTTVLVADAGAAVTYERATQTLQLRRGDAVVARSGPDHRGAAFASTLVHAFARPGDRVAVLGVGTGHLPDLLLRSGRHEVEVVDPAGHAARFAQALGLDGPVLSVARPSRDPRVRVVVAPLRAALAAMPDGSRQALLAATVPASPERTIEHQCELRRVAGAGLVLQPFTLDDTPVDALRALLGAAAFAHPWNAVLAVGDDAWLLSATAPPPWPDDSASRGWSDEARWIAHEAHLGGGLDLRRAWHGTVLDAARDFAVLADAPPPPAGPVGRRAVLALLHELLRAEPLAAVADPHSLLLRWLGRRVELQLAADEIGALADSDDGRRRAQATAARLLATGSPAAVLQAALGLPADDGPPLVDPGLAARRAHAIDPTWSSAPPPVLGPGSLPRPVAATGELEDLAVLPPPARLVAMCVGGAPLAVALRVRFGSACARALVERLAAGSLLPPEAEALRELGDPFVLDEAVRVLQARGALPELLPLWRRDLPMPRALAPLLAAPDTALRLLPALAGRTDAGSLRALADGLAAPAVELRRVAGTALRATVGDTIAYDPEWPRSALNEAADRVRSLHNRAP